MAEECRRSDAMASELNRVVEALEKECRAELKPDDPEHHRGNLTLVCDELVSGYSETCFYPTVNDVIEVLSKKESIKAELAKVESCITKMKLGKPLI